MKAKLLQSLRKNGESIDAEPGKIVIVDLDDDEFQRLAAMDVVVAATVEELLVSGFKIEPVVEEPAVEEPVVEEPAVEEPAVEEPAVEEPAVEEPAVEEPKAKRGRKAAVVDDDEI